MNNVETVAGNTLSYQIWDLKYRLKDKDGNPIDVTVEDTWKRVANAIAVNEKNKDEWSTKFYDILSDYKFLPGGRILSNAGTGRKKTTMNNCYVMGTIEDSMEGILKILTESALTQRQGGGIGLDYSTLRPQGEYVSGVQAQSSGPVSFMHMFDSMCKTIMSAGSRRGAMLAALRIDHPDIELFIDAKRDNVSLKNFNLSVAITDAFMKAVKDDSDFDLKFNGKVYRTVNARYLWDRITKSTYDYAEPGVIFIDRANEMNNLNYCEVIATTNPCGEQLLGANSNCLLGSLNLTKFVKNPFSDNAGIDYALIKSVVPTVVRFLDNVIDITNFPLKQQETEAKNKRRMGVGITGLADVLAMLGIKYGSKESLEVADKIMKTITETAYMASSLLASEKGSFPVYDKDKYLNSKFVSKLSNSVKESIAANGIRNSHLTSIAPTGTISLYAGNVSSGLEPIFALEYKRKYRANNEEEIEQTVYDYAVLMYRDKFGNKPLPKYFTTVSDLTPEQHIDIQAVLQKWVDSSISKTINIPSDFSFEQFQNVYTYAYQSGCKGCTTYRPNSNLKSILSTGTTANKFVSTNAPKRPVDLPAHIYHFKSGEDWIAIIGLYDGRPYEVFAGKAADIQVSPSVKEAFIVKRKLMHTTKYDLIINRGQDNEIVIKDIVSQFNNDAYGSQTRLISLAIRHGASIRFVVEQLEKDSNKDLHSFHKGIMRVLKRYIEDGTACSRKCPQCESDMKFVDGCPVCTQCGFSKCG
jgi:ribonucleoside-diphosphate reductase alpha chain